MFNIAIDPAPDFFSTVSFEAHPHFQVAKPARLFEAVDVELVPVRGRGEIRRRYSERRGKETLVPNQDGSGIQRSVEPFVRIECDGVRKFDALKRPGPFLRKQDASAI